MKFPQKRIFIWFSGFIIEMRFKLTIIDFFWFPAFSFFYHCIPHFEWNRYPIPEKRVEQCPNKTLGNRINWLNVFVVDYIVNRSNAKSVCTVHNGIRNGERRNNQNVFHFDHKSVETKFDVNLKKTESMQVMRADPFHHIVPVFLHNDWSDISPIESSDNKFIHKRVLEHNFSKSLHFLTLQGKVVIPDHNPSVDPSEVHSPNHKKLETVEESHSQSIVRKHGNVKEEADQSKEM